MPAVHEGLASLGLSVPEGSFIIIWRQKANAERGLVMGISSTPILQIRKIRPGKDMPGAPHYSETERRLEAGFAVSCSRAFLVCACTQVHRVGGQAHDTFQGSKSSTEVHISRPR